jgi:periplasmic divalent cation tolerance protein
VTALIYCPFPDRESAEKVAARLLDERLIACINIGAGIHSLFIWGGESGEGDEVPALLKTDAGLLRQAIERLECLHPYETPAILGWPCEASAGTSAWLGDLHEGKQGDAH